MSRPIPGPLWPPTDDPVENSLRRAYLRAPLPVAPPPGGKPDHLQDLLAELTEVLRKPGQMRQRA